MPFKQKSNGSIWHEPFPPMCGTVSTESAAALVQENINQNMVTTWIVAMATNEKKSCSECVDSLPSWPLHTLFGTACFKLYFVLQAFDQHTKLPVARHHTNAFARKIKNTVFKFLRSLRIPAFDQMYKSSAFRYIKFSQSVAETEQAIPLSA